MLAMTYEKNGVHLGSNHGLWWVLGWPFRIRNKWQAVCRCECGTTKLVLLQHLQSGASGNCGCVRKAAFNGRTHGKSKTRLYKVWKGIRERCGNPKNKGFARYGGRGISVCEEWQRDFAAFERWAIANGWRGGLQVDRKDNDGNYEPSNCRIVTNQQNANNTRTNRTLHAFGETKSMSEWSRDARCAVSYGCLKNRIYEGWSSELAMTTKDRRDLGLTPILEKWLNSLGEKK